jgi:hypothetical protein
MQKPMELDGQHRVRGGMVRERHGALPIMISFRRRPATCAELLFVEDFRRREHMP